MRTAIRFAYDGTRFGGYPPAEGRRTVEGALLDALREQVPSAVLRSGSRTDRGVSAVANVALVESDRAIDPRRLAAGLEDIWITGVATVGASFRPRLADWRWYRYHLVERSLDPVLASRCADLFVGTHDFRNFARVDARDTRRTVLRSEVNAMDDRPVVTLDIVGRSFLWRMVRRIAAAVEAVGTGNASVDELREALERSGTRRTFGTAPPEPLVLMKVRYGGLVFEDVGPSKAAVRRARGVLGEAMARATVAGDIVGR